MKTFDIVMLLIGGPWIAVVMWRLDDDVNTFRSSKKFSKRAVLIVIWLITVLFIGIILSGRNVPWSIH